MRRKKRTSDKAPHDRWLVSYADLMTLLFAFFVVMYAVSSVNERKFKTVSAYIAGALTGQPVAKVIVIGSTPAVLLTPVQDPRNKPTMLPEAMAREKKRMTHLAKDIMKVLAPLVKEGKVRVTQTPKGVTVEINASVLFGPGDAALSNESHQALTAVGIVLKDDNHKVIVEGHTDINPIQNAFFASNWELSAARASRVVRLLSDIGVDEKRLTAAGKASTEPVADNSSSLGRARNRRVSILILSELDVAKELPLN